jgi:hypothetical protein
MLPLSNGQYQLPTYLHTNIEWSTLCSGINPSKSASWILGREDLNVKQALQIDVRSEPGCE